MIEHTPYACLACRKSFKRHARSGIVLCPVCGKSAIELHHDFKPPRTSNIKQWEKVRYLIQNGFRFRPIWDDEAGKPVSYPETFRDAIEWVERWKSLAVTRGGPVSAEPTADAGQPGLTVSEVKKRTQRRAAR